MADYDGTLAPFRLRRDEALPDDAVLESLDRLSRGDTRIVIISGRAADDVAALLGLEHRPEIWGCHGAERLTAGGERHLPPVGEDEKDLLAKGAEEAFKRLPSKRVELKPLSVAAHFRGLGGEETGRAEAALLSAWRPLAEKGGEIRPFNGGLELRLKGHHKGQAVRALVAEEPQAAAAYIGDDETDEDAFAALPPSALGLLVGDEDRPTAAKGHIRAEEVAALLEEWAEIRERRMNGDEG